MHAKVTIASLVFGLTIGFSTGVVKSNTKTTKLQEENMVCNYDDHEHIHQSPSEKKAALKDFSIKEDVRATHTHSYTYSYEYLNDGRHKAYCSCGAYSNQDHVFTAYSPYGHGHNDMIYCSQCNTNIETPPIYCDQSVSESVASGAAKWYLFVPQETGTYTFETTGSSDTYGELYIGEYPTVRTTYNDDGGTNRNFKISYYLTYGQNVFLRVRGYNWYAASYALIVSKNHVHNYNQMQQYNSQSHKLVCSCGEYVLQQHTYSNWQSYTSAFHKKTCACGSTIMEEHHFTDYLPYGHGHNDLIFCEECQTSVECTRLEGYPVSGYIDIDDADWYLFICQESGTYTFETTGTTDTVGTLYISDYPTGIPVEDDDSGTDNNFKITQYLECGEIAFLRVYGYDWYHYGSYTINVTRVYPQEQVKDWTIMIYMCGSNTLTGAALSDIQEILSVNGQPNDVNIILEVGGATSWPSNSYGLTGGCLKRYYVSNGSLVPCPGDDPTGSMGDQSTFEAFLNWGFTQYPAEKTGVILWNHGGALDGVCYDNNYGMNPLLNSEVNAALDHALLSNNINSKLQFIGYDACLMQMQDVAEFNSEHFKYMVASEEIEGGDGWEYDRWIDNLYRKENTLSILSEIVYTYVQYSGYANKGTLSLLELSKMLSYQREFETLANDIRGAVNSNYDEFVDVIESTKYFAYGHYDSYGSIDAYDFLNKLENNTHFSAALDQIYRVKNYFQQLVYYSEKQSGAGQANGLALHICICDNQTYPTTETHFQSWRSLFFD